jgi:SAM-dependent methyltransferase
MLNHGDDPPVVHDYKVVDGVNARFYGRFPYPWPPMVFPQLEDKSIETVMLNQSAGDWRLTTVPLDARMWVAGCGTNQAIYTALRFPHASIIASDISESSLEISKHNAKSLGLANISFRNESINEIDYEDEFDYVLCTGVIHHNADPRIPLTKISSALRRHGLLELMVYNKYHRLTFNAIQEATALLSATELATGDLTGHLDIAKAVITSGHFVGVDGSQLAALPETDLADALIQPVEHTYTVRTLRDLAAACGLELKLPCFNQFDQAAKRSSWSTLFSDYTLKDRFDRLSDVNRWQVTNLLLREESPMLWFFMQHGGDTDKPHFERDVCDEFLKHRFSRVQTRLRNFIRQPDGSYESARGTISFPPNPSDKRINSVLEAVNPNVSMREVLTTAKVDTNDLNAVNDVRIKTTTTLCPCLRVIL